ncbi:MAG TPA: transcriptional regulator, partial [Cupriavidus sp.]|nr:transcriptional regulator [Cupriavidus sp.]
CMGAAGVRDLTFLDVLVLHHVNHRGRAKRLADICFVLNVEDTHLVTYALKKLVGLGLVAGERVGK